jgi:hypothetical protein
MTRLTPTHRLLLLKQRLPTEAHMGGLLLAADADLELQAWAQTLKASADRMSS